MTPEQFYKLDEMEQAEVVWEGKHIGDRQDEDYIILLYKNDELYIEVFFHKIHQVIKKPEALSRSEILEIYTFKTNFGGN